jgi:hypothetical protein
VRRQLEIDAATELEPHDHVAWCGEGTDDLYALAGVALAAGAARHEKLLLVAEDPDAGRLGALGDLERLLHSGQLELHSIGEVYATGSDFNPARQLAIFQGVLASALAQGYTGIRVVADNTPFISGEEEAFRRWLAWEQLTDRFQARSEVTGVCYFDSGAVDSERLADLAALHPVRSATSEPPRFNVFADDDAVLLTGTFDSWSARRFTRIITATPADAPLLVDLSRAEFVDHRALLALNRAATEARPVLIRGADPAMRQLPGLLGIETPHLRFV